MVVTLIQTTFFIVLSALFSASEVSLFSIPRNEQSSLGTGGKREKRVKVLLEKGEDTLIAILLGNIFVNIMIISGVGKLLGESSAVLFFFVSTGVLLVCGEIAPKAVALQLGKRVILVTAPLILIMQKLFFPFIMMLRKVNRNLLRWNYYFVLSSPFPYITNDEYLSALDRASSKGEISKESAHFIKEMSEVMEFPLSRVVTHRTLLSDDTRISEAELQSLEWIAVSKSIGDAIALLRDESSNSLAAHDEYGEFYGIVTRENITSYIMSLQDEDDVTGESIIVDGSAPVVKYLEWFDEEILDRFPDVQSVGGIISTWAEAIPVVGSVLESESYIFTVVEAGDNSVKKIQIVRK